MKCPRPFFSLALLFSILSVSSASVLPNHVHAASSPASAWVMDDITAQSHCRIESTNPLRNSGPCPAGSIYHVYQMPLTMVEAQHRSSYLPTTASPAEEVRWEETHERAQPMSTNTPDYVGCTPVTGASATLFWTTNYGSSVSTGVTYNVDNSCLFRAQYDLTQYNGGAEAHKHNPAFMRDFTTNNYGADVDANAVGSCNGLPDKAGFIGNPIKASDHLNAGVFYIYDHSVNQACVDAHDSANFDL